MSRVELPISSNSRLIIWSHIDTADKALKRNNIQIVAMEHEDQIQLIYVDKNDSVFIKTTSPNDPWTIPTQYLTPKLAKRINLICNGRKLVKLHHVQADTVEFSYSNCTGAEVAILWFLHIEKWNLAVILIVGKKGYKSHIGTLVHKIINISSEQHIELESVKLGRLLQPSGPHSQVTKIGSIKASRISGSLGSSISASLSQLLNDAISSAHWIKLQVDPEFLHQFRTSLRKSLAILKYFQSVFGAHETETFESEVRFLLYQSSTVRDLDVFRGLLVQFQANKQGCLDLTSLIEICDSRLFSKYSEVARELNSPRFEALLSEWKRLLVRSRAHIPQNMNSSKQFTVGEKIPVDRPLPDNILSPEASLLDLVNYFMPLVSRYHAMAIALIQSNASDAKLHSARKQLRDAKYIFEILQLSKQGSKYSKFYKEISVTTQSLGQIHDLKIQMKLLNDIQADLEVVKPDIAVITHHLKTTRKHLIHQQHKRIQTINLPY